MDKELKGIQVLTTNSQEKEILERAMKEDGMSDGLQNRLEILEAGCGRNWWLDLAPVKYTLTGVDLDRSALDYRKNEVKDLDEAIEGDLCSIDLELSHYDIIFSAYVLEHIEDADLALSNFVRWVKPGGLIVLQFPDRNSVYGFITRLTPFWVHMMYARYLSPWRKADAGTKGRGPYPTFYAPVVSRKGIRRFSRNKDLVIKAEYGSNRYVAESKGMRALMMKVVVWTVFVLSLGTLEHRYNNLLYVLRKADA